MRTARRMEDPWLTQEDVASFCPGCAKRMAETGVSRIRASVLRTAAMTWDECIAEAKKKGARDPEALCGWLKAHGPNAKKGEVEHEWQQGHSSLLRTRPDYNEEDIIEEDEVDEWLDRDQVAAICPACADKMDAKGICRIKSSVIENAKREAERTAGILRKPENVVKEMRKWGLSMGEGGEVYFSPLSPIGIPMSGTQMKVKDIEAAVRQTAHVKDGISGKIESFKNLLDKLSRLFKFLKVADPNDPDAVETSLDVYDMDVRPLEPSSRVRSKTMKDIRTALMDIRALVMDGAFRRAMVAIRDVQGAIEGASVMFEKQSDVWNERRQLLMAVRNLIRKYPDMSPALVTASRKAAKKVRLNQSEINNSETSLNGREYTIIRRPQADGRFWVAAIDVETGQVLEEKFADTKEEVRKAVKEVNRWLDKMGRSGPMSWKSRHRSHTAARGPVTLKKIPGAMMERETRYMIQFRGKDWGELYFNMRGYVAEHGIPVPRSDGSEKPIGLSIGEKSLSRFKREISMANREWAEHDAGRTAASRPNIGPGVKLQGKRGIYKVTMGPSELTLGPRGYSRMMDAGYTHWLRLESPLGKEFEFYVREGDRNTLYWYKNHRTMVPMKFENTALPPDPKELVRRFPSDRPLQEMHKSLMEFDREVRKSGLPNADKISEAIGKVISDLVGASMALDNARRSVTARTAAKWETMPKGWTNESRKKFWESLTGDVKHKVTKCIKEMDGKVSDPGAFCAALADRVEGKGWRSER